MKKILGILIVILVVFLIYIGFKDKKVYYLTLGDGLSLGVTPYGGVDYGFSNYIKDYLEEKNMLETFVNEFSVANYRTTDLIIAIQDNKKVEIAGKERTIQHALIKADLVTLAIGFNDLFLNMDFSSEFTIRDFEYRFDEVLDDLETLFELLRQYCKEKIVMVGFFDSKGDETLADLFTYINGKVKALANEFNITYIDVYEEMKNDNYFPNDKSIFPSKEGYKVIADEIIKELEENLKR